MSRPTSKSLSGVRADMLASFLEPRCPSFENDHVEDAPALVVEDVYALRALRCWTREAIGQALDVLVSDGRLTTDAHGYLRLRQAGEDNGLREVR